MLMTLFLKFPIQNRVSANICAHRNTCARVTSENRVGGYMIEVVHSSALVAI
jgi:hypothetical protein